MEPTALVIPSDSQEDLRLFRCESEAVQQSDGSYEKLSDTGLYCDAEPGRIARSARFYEPEFSLWADGASKRRFLQLPEGTQIDTSDMDRWVFPVGTRVWKEFSQAGQKLETRLLEKRGEGAWFAMAFAWNEDESEAFPAPAGASDARGTDHDVPSVLQCGSCHRGAADTVLSVAALPLARASFFGVTLSTLARAGRLSAPPAVRIDFPGKPLERAALGYLHANCSNCHGGSRPFAGLNLSTSVHDTAVADTQVYKTAIDQPLTRWTGRGYDYRVVPGEPAQSGLLARMAKRGPGEQMPPLGTEKADVAAIWGLSAWIHGLE